MTMMSKVVAAGQTTTLPQIATIPGLSAGTMVLTLAGAIPVEHLTAGDRIITRDGARKLVSVQSTVHTDAQMILVSASALGVEQPEEDMFLAPHQQILIRDWRAKALKGADQAVVCADKLIDGEYIRAAHVAEQRLFALEFDCAVVIYAGGLELAATMAPTEA
ncbi:MAG: Hint domain-containing protein [Paracoccaceae bacterium]